MNFSSLSFLTIFLPIALGLSWAFWRVGNWVLLALSMGFIFWHDGVGLLWLLGSVCVTDGCVRWMGKESGVKRRWICGVAIGLQVILLGVFKTSGFVLGGAWKGLEALAPLGISFFTFSSISYVLDVYWGVAACAKTPLESACYLLMFPKLTAGPIARYGEVSEALGRGRRFELGLVVSGFRRFLCGLAKKVLIADTVGVMADAVWGVAGEGHGVPMVMAWLGLVSYALQLYFDFSGYSDMAIGVGRMLGFRMEENFRYPYGATSIRDFWRRWHISLSRWFRDYVYIPLGGNRYGVGRACINSLVVFVLCGLWHNAGWMFLLWGLWHGLFITLERLVPKPKRAGVWMRMGGHVYTTAVFLLGWLLFRSHGFADCGVMVRSLMGVADEAREARVLWLELTPTFWLMFCVGMVCAYPVVPWVRGWVRRVVGEEVAFGVENGVLTIVFLVSIFFLAGASYHAFLYQQF